MAWLQYHKEGKPLSYMDERNKEREGIIDTVHIEINKYQKRIWYSVVLDNGDTIYVDGETFRKI